MVVRKSGYGDEIRLSPEEKERAETLERTVLDRNTYRALKRDLIGEEAENAGEIVMLKCSGEGNWFEIAEHSALLYYYHVCQMLKIKGIRFEDDYDSFYEQYQIGRIRTRGINTVRERIQRAGVYGGEHVMTGRVVFVLKKQLSKDRMKALEKKEAKRRMDLNKTIEVAHSDPLFYRNLAALIKWLHTVCSSKLTKLSSDTIGKMMVTLADEMMMDYFHSTDLSEENIDGRVEDWKNIRIKAYKLKYALQVVDVAGLWSPEVCLKAFEKIDEIRGLANKNLMAALRDQKKVVHSAPCKAGEKNEGTAETS